MSSDTNIPATPLPYDGVRAPDFPAGLPWLNTEEPLSLRGLHGKVVLLDFWTHGCINCLHILPNLKELEAKYSRELVVIGVHSAKFTAEADVESVRSAVLRHKIEHPVIVDRNSRIWSDYAVKAWPTLVLIDPNGRVAGQVAGEGHFPTLDATIAELVAQAAARGQLNETPLQFALEGAKAPNTPLSFPGKILSSGGVLYIADSGHNRIVKATASGRIEAVVGSGIAGMKDGTFAEAQFRNPQGMALDGDKLIVADTDNHALRLVDFERGTVSTIAGNGRQAAYMATGGIGAKTELSSPWDVLKVGETLVIIMAGNHQIWQYDITSRKVSVLAGSGAEGRHDGTFEDAAFAQPSGLALSDNSIIVVDAESSCIRQLDLRKKTVETLAGGDLFDFGDMDGHGDGVRLQHPLGITRGENDFYIADTYNSKIKKLDGKSGEATTVFSAGLNQPGGIAFDDDILFIADTNNGVIKMLALASLEVTTLQFERLEPPKPVVEEEPSTAISEETVILAPDAMGKLVFEALLPEGFHLNHSALIRLNVRVEREGLSLEKDRIAGDEFIMPLEIPFQTELSGSGTVELEATVSYCSSGKNALCKVERVQRRFSFEIRAGGVREVRVEEALI